VSAITPAASVLLARGRGSGEVFVVGRSPGLRFMGGFHAFPGGKVHRSDAAPAWPAGVTPDRVAAVRELFEETGVLLARRPDGTFPLAGEELDSGRRELLAEQVRFDELLCRWGLQVRADDLVGAGHLVTPPFAPVRFDTTFFVAFLPPGQQPEVWAGELTDGRWSTAAAALDEWAGGRLALSPPTVSILEAIRGEAVEKLPERLGPALADADAGRLPVIWFSPAVQLIPLRSEVLPPATHTNAWLVGTGPVYLIDPGAVEAAEQEVLFAALDAQAAAGRPLSAVVLTHHHPDHAGAASACANRYGVPVRAHPLTARALRDTVAVRGDLRDGDRLDLGLCPDGSGRWQLEALYTPGHAPGHLAFWEPRYGLLFPGDLASTLSSVLIAPPEGDLALYLDSVARLRELPARLLLPAHGPVSARPAFVLDETLAHRRDRERQLLDALASGPRTPAELAQEVYRGLPEALLQYARLQTLAGLYKLRHEGRAACTTLPDGETWRRSDR
jgi:glyoxylase-like metal-dependent hydrolase (beta-lactamase superfamily II)/8-oxo-dGTP pyrophosphatase MutT (NUDIX family)